MCNEPNKCGKSNEDSLCAMAKDFYNKKMVSVIVLVWSFGIIIIAGAVWSAIEFFKAEDTKVAILYAVVFLSCVTWMNLMKSFAWMMIHRNGLMRQIRKLQCQVSELSEKVNK